jgi:hypothetical protein
MYLESATHEHEHLLAFIPAFYDGIRRKSNDDVVSE